MNALLRAIFPPSDQNWTWRRRMAFSGCAVFLWGIVYAIRFEPDHAWGSVVLTNCILGFSGTLATYVGIATMDDNNKRKTEAQIATAPTMTATSSPSGATVTTTGINPEPKL